MQFPTITRLDPAIVAALAEIGSATAAGEMAHMGIRDPHIRGPVSFKKGKAIAGPALTLQFMPKREDLHGGGEYEDPEKQLHRHVLYQVERGAVVVPVAMAEGLIERASKHAEWEEFSRLRLSEGGDLRRYYPLSAEVEPEYRAWKAAQG